VLQKRVNITETYNKQLRLQPLQTQKDGNVSTIYCKLSTKLIWPYLSENTCGQHSFYFYMYVRMNE